MQRQPNLEQVEAHAWEMLPRLALLIADDARRTDLDALEEDAEVLARAVENLVLSRKLRVMRKLSNDD